jgi:serine/threonine protein kinase
VHLIKAIAFILREGRNEFSFVFPWAEHGNLWEFWFRQESAPRNHDYFIQVFQQLTCLAHAINWLSNKNIRHGDLKPENIVCFETDRGLPAVGGNNPNAMIRLVIIDVGLAKPHDKETDLRVRAITETRVSTKRYQAPELETTTYLSRRFDVWSMGCIFLEFAIWLIYGRQRLQSFPADGTPSHQFKFFVTKLNHEYLDSSQGPKQIADRHDTVNKVITEMQNNPSCSSGTAIRRLVDLISDKMLIVDLSDDRPPDPNTEGQSTCQCVQDVDSVLRHSAENNTDEKQKIIPESNPSAQQSGPEIIISRAETMRTNTFPTKKNNSGRPGRPYARVIKEELESILADMENGRINAIKLDDKMTKPTEASGHLNVLAHRVR